MGLGMFGIQALVVFVCSSFARSFGCYGSRGLGSWILGVYGITAPGGGIQGSRLRV